jgi:hypothetical protein
MRRISKIFIALVTAFSYLTVAPANAVTCYTLTGTTISSGGSCSGAITIPDSVTAIANNTFQNATSLTAVTFGANSLLTTIGNSAFIHTTSLLELVIPKGVTVIEPFTFAETYNLTSITLPDSVTAIGSGAFNNARSLTTFTFPKNVTTISDGLFLGASSLTNVIYASGSAITTISDFAFNSTISLQQITIPASVTTIGDYAFQDASLLESVYFSGSVSPTVGDQVFQRVKSGAKAYIQTGATGFDPIEGLWKGLIVAPATTAPNAPTIGTATAISPTSASISFTAPTSNGGATIETYTATSTPGSITGRVLQAGSGSITVTGLTSSTAYTFSVTASNSAGISSASSASVSITTPASDAEVAAQVAARAAAALAAQKAAEAKREAEKQAAQTEIWDCLTESRLITINNFNSAEIYGVTKKNYDHVIQDINYKLFDESNTAFIESQNLTIFVVEQVVKKYVILDAICYPGTFSQFTANDLASVDLIPYKNRNAITYNLRQLPLVERNDYIKIENAINNEILVLETRKERLNEVLAWDYPEKNLVAEPASTGTFPCGSGGTYTVVSGHVTGSDKCAGKLTFVSSVIAIDDYAFAQSRYIRGKSSMWIRQEPQITELVVPNTVKSIGASAFSDNEFLITISISDSVKTIGREAFRQSNNVTSLTIGSGAALIESDTYQEFKYLTKLVVPEGVTRIDAGAFSELYSVTSLSLPSTLVTLGEASLRGMHSLRTMNIPANLSITYDPFHYFWYAPLSVPYLCSTTGASNTSSVNAYFATLIAYNTTAGRCTNSFEAPEIVGTYRQSPTTATLKFIAPQSFGAGTAHTSYEVIAFPGGKRTSFPGGVFTQKVTISSLNPGTSYGFEVVAINNESPFIASPPSRRRYVSAE